MKYTSGYCKNQVFSPSVLFFFVDDPTSMFLSASECPASSSFVYGVSDQMPTAVLISMLVGMGEYIPPGLTFFVIDVEDQVRF